MDYFITPTHNYNIFQFLCPDQSLLLKHSAQCQDFYFKNYQQTFRSDTTFSFKVDEHEKTM